MEISTELGRLWRLEDHLGLDEEPAACFRPDVVEPKEVVEREEPCKTEEQQRELVEVDAGQIGDFPARYTVGDLRKEEFLAVGVYVDTRIIPGFKYRVRPLHDVPSGGGKECWLWGGAALILESIGRGYSRRLTFSPPPGGRNANPHYFWADSSEWGFAFQPELVSPGDQFTVFDSSNFPVASLTVLQSQEAQVELSQRLLDDGSLEKTAKVKALVEVEWYSQELAQPTNTLPMTGRAVSVKKRTGEVVTKVVGVTLAGRGYTLRPGTSLRTTLVRGASILDVPTTYTIIGLEPHHLPVIGTYIDPRIAVGFHYRISRVGGERRKWVWKEPVKLVSIGKGYGKRLVFSPADPPHTHAPLPERLNDPQLYLWSDSHPDGLGFEHAAVRAGTRFAVYSGDLHLGSAHVFRADAPQIERRQYKTKEGIVKEIHVELTCTVVLGTSSSADTMRVSGTAVLLKEKASQSARLLRLQDVGLESQLNLLFLTPAEELLFVPL